MKKETPYCLYEWRRRGRRSREEEKGGRRRGCLTVRTGKLVSARAQAVTNLTSQTLSFHSFITCSTPRVDTVSCSDEVYVCVWVVDLSIGMTVSVRHEVLPQLPPRNTSQNGGGGRGVE